MTNGALLLSANAGAASGSLGTSGNVTIGSPTSTNNVASLLTAGSGVSVGTNLTVISDGGTSAAVLGVNNSDSGANFSGTITIGATGNLASNLTLSAASGGTVTFTGPIVDAVDNVGGAIQNRCRHGRPLGQQHVHRRDDCLGRHSEARLHHEQHQQDRQRLGPKHERRQAACPGQHVGQYEPIGQQPVDRREARRLST